MVSICAGGPLRLLFSSQKLFLKKQDKPIMQHTSHAPEAHHEEPGFWRKYIFSTDHKVIGMQYGITALLFMFFGFCLMLLMRWQIAHPGQAVPLLGKLLLKIHGPDMISADSGQAGTGPMGVIGADLYNSYGAMHGTIMVFLAVVPLAFGAFGNFVTPLQIGAPDMAFPRVNMASYQFYFMGGVVMLASFFIPGGAAKVGLDVLFAAGHGGGPAPAQWTDLLDYRHGLPDQLLAPGRGQFHHHHHSIAGQGAELDAPAVFRLGAICHRPFCCSWPSRRWKPPGCCNWRTISWARAFSCRPGWSFPGRRCMSAAGAARCSGSICSGSWAIRRSMC